MTELSESERRATLEKAWGPLIFSPWDQMEWFIRLANTDLAALTPGDILNLQDQCAAILLKQVSLFPTLSDRKRYPYHHGWGSSASPSFPHLQQIHAAIAPRLIALADAGDGQGPAFTITPGRVSTKFVKSSEAEQHAEYPRYQIYLTVDMGIGEPWAAEFVLRVVQLLQTRFPTSAKRNPTGRMLVDALRRCPHCQKVFLQWRQNARFCGPGCYSVFGMRQRREAHKAKELKRKNKKQGLSTTQKGGARHGKKRR